MLKLNSSKTVHVKKFKVALEVLKEELSVLGFARKYKINPKEAREFKKWCHETYYYKSYKTPSHS
ncbi:MAG: hypothetical protein OCD02_06215 [Spirochaetaceae bacterium]